MLESLHQPVLDHGLAAAAALLRRLEDHHRGAGEIARLGEIARGAQQHGGVAVMAAGVHLARHRRLVRQVGRLLDRQRVHVGAQADRLVRRALAAADDADHAGAAEPVTTSSQPKSFSFSATVARGAVDVVEQLGMGVQIVPPFGDFVAQVGDAVDDRHWSGSWRLGSGGQCSKPRATCASSRIMRAPPIDRAGQRPYTAPGA